MSAETPANITISRSCTEAPNATLSGKYAIGDKSAFVCCNACGACGTVDLDDQSPEYGRLTATCGITGKEIQPSY